jgi:diguanylate cyclase (GGDEF)-like protein
VSTSIFRDLEDTERREAQLWILAFALLGLFGVVIIAHFAVTLLGDSDSSAGLTRTTAITALTGLFFLIALFCLRVLRTLLVDRRMKSLLTEMGRVAASGMELDGFLPSIARKLVETSEATTCQIALLDCGSTTLRIRSAQATEGTNWKPDVGRSCALKELYAWEQLSETLQPVSLERRDLERLSPGDRLFLGGGLEGASSILILPMVTKNGILGIVTLGYAGRFKHGWFAPSEVPLLRTLVNHAAGAIDQSQIRRQAIRDPLTNVYNRRHFAERIREEIARAEREKHLMVVLLCDLDCFKQVNDTRGHQVGDAVLKAAVKGIQDSTRGTDLVFRWGGDEFVIVLPKSTREGALIVAKRIRQAVLKTAEAFDLSFDVSIGLALYPEHGGDEDELMRVADKALYIAKQYGGKTQVGEEEYRLDSGSIKVVFQPVVEMPSGRVLGYEALIRDPRGKLSPIQMFEKYGAVGRLDELKRIIFELQIRTARELGLERVFINADFQLLSELGRGSIPDCKDVVVELSEREALDDLESLLQVARKWRDRGCEFAIDDFGAGFISLPFLAMLVPEYVKVDRSTLLEAATSERFKGFLKSLVQAVRTYATAGVIAEGVEKDEELQTVHDLGISLVQGFLLGRPEEILDPVGAASEGRGRPTTRTGNA